MKYSFIISSKKLIQPPYLNTRFPKTCQNLLFPSSFPIFTPVNIFFYHPSMKFHRVNCKFDCQLPTKAIAEKEVWLKLSANARVSVMSAMHHTNIHNYVLYCEHVSCIYVINCRLHCLHVYLYRYLRLHLCVLVIRRYMPDPTYIWMCKRVCVCRVYYLINVVLELCNFCFNIHVKFIVLLLLVMLLFLVLFASRILIVKSWIVLLII